MSESNDGRRKLTPFLAHEMLYDYVVGNLDPERRAAVESFIESDRESQNLLESIRRGLRYAERLTELSLPPQEIEQISSAESFVSISKRMSHWSAWPDAVRWSIVALFVSSMTALTVVGVPWNQISQFLPSWKPNFTTEHGEHLKLADLSGAQSEEEESEEATSAAQNQTSDSSATGDSSGDQEFADTSTDNATTVASDSARGSSQVLTSATPTLVAKAATPSLLPTPQAPTHPATTAAVQDSTPKKPNQQGFVNRAFMSIEGLDELAPKIVVQIKELGAEKAGEVELGWKRGTGRYFHFAIPEANEARLLEVLRAYGPVRISKDVHPRLMPPGQLRFILWIESSGN